MSQEQRRIWNRRAYEKRKARHPESEQIEHTSNKEHFLGKRELSEETEFPEHRAYSEAFETPRDLDQRRFEERLNKALNPRLMVKKQADNPESYGEKGVLICSVHGCPLTKRGCPVCNGEQDG